METKSIGLIELSSIAAGYQTADAMLKAGDVQLLLSRSICSGKYMVLIGGETGPVQSAVDAGVSAAGGFLIESACFPNLHPDIFSAMGRSMPTELSGALGVLESFNVATLIQAADAAVKTADVTLLEIRLAMAMGGKGVVTMTGSVASVEAAVAAGRTVLSDAGVLVHATVIPKPHKDSWREWV